MAETGTGRADGADGTDRGGASRADDTRWLRRAIELSRRCPEVPSAYSVGAVVVSADGRVLAEGYSRDVDDTVHAEESALARLAAANGAPGGVPGGVPGGGTARELRDATVYSSLEPCSSRRSRPRSCTELILDAGIGRVVFAYREPPLLARCEGAALLSSAGVEVVELPELAGEVAEVNAHILRTE
ncbi:dCMP deaminase [Streptomyces carminius]|uniref:dCMP deaminase n=1 Tax=Streptomyces carminius TaxID=2665496 RepID=A0A2M8M5I7_9ACTN|nr:dCMP deaminase [Streptomyces carminius]PJE99463.1 dCMP deaminase [Streptomyces carminius]